MLIDYMSTSFFHPHIPSPSIYGSQRWPLLIDVMLLPIFLNTWQQEQAYVCAAKCCLSRQLSDKLCKGRLGIFLTLSIMTDVLRGFCCAEDSCRKLLPRQLLGLCNPRPDLEQTSEADERWWMG